MYLSSIFAFAFNFNSSKLEMIFFRLLGVHSDTFGSYVMSDEYFYTKHTVINKKDLVHVFNKMLISTQFHPSSRNAQ